MDLDLEVNPDARIQHFNLPDGEPCVIVDDFLAFPDRVRAAIIARSDLFAGVSGHQFPGSAVPLAEPVYKPFREFVRHRLRHLFGVARTITEHHCRVSLVHRAPEELNLLQRVPHRDSAPGNVPDEKLLASVVYLFEDPGFGGTALYREIGDYYSILENASPGDMDRLARQHEFFRRPPAYMTESNEFFEQLAVVEPRYNRAVFYNGSVPHTGHILHPEWLSSDPARGRLTINGFYACINTR